MHRLNYFSVIEYSVGVNKMRFMWKCELLLYSTLAVDCYLRLNDKFRFNKAGAFVSAKSVRIHK